MEGFHCWCCGAIEIWSNVKERHVCILKTDFYGVFFAMIAASVTFACVIFASLAAALMLQGYLPEIWTFIYQLSHGAFSPHASTQTLPCFHKVLSSALKWPKFKGSYVIKPFWPISKHCPVKPQFFPVVHWTTEAELSQQQVLQKKNRYSYSPIGFTPLIFRLLEAFLCPFEESNLVFFQSQIH